MTATHSALTLTLVAMLMWFGNGIGMTLSPEIGRPPFLGLWRELSDTGQGVGPLILSGVTAAAGLVAGIIVSGLVGFAAAAVLWVFIPRRAPLPLRAPRSLRRVERLLRPTEYPVGALGTAGLRSEASSGAGSARPDQVESRSVPYLDFLQLPAARSHLAVDRGGRSCRRWRARAS
jgi:hypothetical protein